MLTSLICLWIGFSAGIVCAALMHGNSIEGVQLGHREAGIDYVI